GIGASAGGVDHAGEERRAGEDTGGGAAGRAAEGEAAADACGMQLQARCDLANGYIPGMKIAVSIPNDVFKRAERFAKLIKKSRSKVYSDAIREYVRRHDPAA